MNINVEMISQELKLFKDRLAPTTDQRIYLQKCDFDIRNKLEAEAEKFGYSIERVLLAAICGELHTEKQRAEFVTRLILIDILTEGT